MTEYFCNDCDYITCNKTAFTRHQHTKKHIATSCKKKHITIRQYKCEECNYITGNKYNYSTHLKTEKHLAKTCKKKHITETGEHVCDICSKTYMSRNGLWYHKRSCNPDATNDAVVAPVSMELFNALIRENKEFKELLLVQNDKMNNLSNKLDGTTIQQNITNNITNNNDNKFNLNIFLNETCKNAMTLEHFLNNLQIEIEDIEYVGNHGYVEGMSHIITERLNALDITERPIHCTDMKRETMHIKCEDAWHKDVDDEKINSLVGIVAKLNYRKLPDWREQHPHFLDSSNPDFDYHMKMLGNILGAQQNANIDKKVIKNIAKHIALDKPRLAMKYK